MRRLALIVLVFLLVSACNDDRSKKDHYSTTQVADHLYVETFTIFNSGAYGGNRVSEYLTDSVSFRIYTGTFDNANEAIGYKLANDTVFTERSCIPGRGEFKEPEKHTYKLDSLKATHKFE